MTARLPTPTVAKSPTTIVAICAPRAANNNGNRPVLPYRASRRREPYSPGRMSTKVTYQIRVSGRNLRIGLSPGQIRGCCPSTKSG
jgi:hypothetical protein